MALIEEAGPGEYELQLNRVEIYSKIVVGTSPKVIRRQDGYFQRLVIN